MNWHLVQTTLELHKQWPMRRTRWWAVLMPQSMPLPRLRSWPIDPHFRTLASVIPRWPSWASSEEELLRFTDHELAYYMDGSFGSDVREVTLDMQCPIILHSYGHALTGCPCGCRGAGFCHARLRDHGLRGFGVQPQVGDRLRLLHPAEAALLLTFPVIPLEPGRCSLPMLGQAAAPLQALCAFSHLLQAADQHFDERHIPDPQQLLTGYKDTLLQQQHDYWPSPSTSPTSTVLLQTDDESFCPISCTPGTTVAQNVWEEIGDAPCRSLTATGGSLRMPSFRGRDVLVPTSSGTSGRDSICPHHMP